VPHEQSVDAHKVARGKKGAIFLFMGEGAGKEDQASHVRAREGRKITLLSRGCKECTTLKNITTRPGHSLVAKP